MIPPAEDRPTLRVEEVAAILQISRSTAFECCARGEIPTLRFGRRIAVPTAALRRMLGLDGEGADE
jgi:excisionase family DNA binding protein